MNINIRKERYDYGHYIIYIEKGAEDLGFSLAICGFHNHMEWLLYDCEHKVINDKTGFVFPNSDSFEDVLAETEDFIKRYKLDK